MEEERGRRRGCRLTCGCGGVWIWRRRVVLGKGESEEVMVCGRTWLLMDGRRWWRIDDEVIGEREREREVVRCGSHCVGHRTCSAVLLWLL